MATALNERAWREATPETVEDELAAIWRDLASRGAVARAVMSNLVVFRFRERRLTGDRERSTEADAQSANATLESVMAQHPSRAIVIEHDRGDHDPQAPVGAGVGVCIFGPPAARYGVEEVIVRSACADVSLPSIVRRFARGDLPTTVWWTEDLSRWPPLQPLVATGRQLVYDSRIWRDVHAGFRVIAPLAAANRIDLADLNWRRLAPLRRALLHGAEAFGAASRMDLRIAHRPGDGALAWLLAGWLAARLRLARDAWAHVEESRMADEIVTLTVDVGGPTMTASLNGHRVLVQTPDVAPITMPATRETAADAVAAELRSLSHDPGLHAAIGALAARVQ